MIEMTTIAWFLAGLAAGLLHASILRRATHRLTAWTPVLGMLRLGVVAAVLVVAARSGAILAAATGWAAGFVPVIALLAGSRTSRAIASPRLPASEQRSTPDVS